MNANNIVRVPSHLTPTKIVLLGAVADGHRVFTEWHEKLISDLKHGRNINKKKYTDTLVSVPITLIYQNVKYSIMMERTSSMSYTLRYREWKADVVVRNLADNGLLVSLDLRSHVLYADWNAAEQVCSLFSLSLSRGLLRVAMFQKCKLLQVKTWCVGLEVTTWHSMLTFLE